jgi:aminopeptidase N
MENKGLNIFNSAYVLANPKTATDGNFYGIESVIGHEYFHNWTGNRVTCRDWFQLTLKEGLTVFRDQEFSADLNSRNVERIQSVLGLRSHQFAEDAGPTSHPIKPESYIEINNFYTSTIYEKGAEVIRMIQTLLGVDGFRKGMDKYFELFDGQAVRTEDFIFAMSEANNKFDFTQFKNWYNQNGTPIVNATTQYDSAKKQFKLTLTQSLPKNTIANAQPFHIPFKVGLVGASGADLVNKTLELKKESEEFVFDNINERPIASLNRDFSAPIKLVSDLSFTDQLFLMAHDSDSFNRFEATQVVATKIMTELIEDIKANRPIKLNEQYVEAFGKILKDQSIDAAFRSLSMSIPAEGILHQEQSEILYPETEAARNFVKKTLANAHHKTIFHLYESVNKGGEYKLDPVSMGERSLSGNCLMFLSLVDGDQYVELPLKQFKSASNMTDEIGALTTLVDSNSVYKDDAINSFYTKWKHETLVMQKWLMAQGSATHDSNYETVLKLENDPIYDRTIPNLVRSLLGSFANNKMQFNHPSGRGYKLIADRMIEIDKLNPQMASRLASAYKDYKRLPASLKSLMKPELDKILGTKDLSKNVFEIVSKILG